MHTCRSSVSVAVIVVVVACALFVNGRRRKLYALVAVMAGLVCFMTVRLYPRVRERQVSCWLQGELLETLRLVGNQ
jgi:uncharacterized membrane protein YphA (DoxX/SURF4 family)